MHNKRSGSRSKFFHACKMLSRNLRGYGLLSVTVVLSFSILLGYLAFTDANHYNEYKEVFAAPRDIVMTSVYDEPERIQMLQDMVSRADPQARSYTYITGTLWMRQYGELVSAGTTFLPEGERPVYETAVTPSYIQVPMKVPLICGRDSFSLHGNEAIIGESLYRLLGEPEGFPFSLMTSLEIGIPTGSADEYYQSFVMVPLSVVGVCEDVRYVEPAHYDKNDNLVFSGEIYTTLTALEMSGVADKIPMDHHIWVCSEHPERVTACIRQLDLLPAASYSAQDYAKAELLEQSEGKLTIVLVMMLILGINLYSCFSNALADRKFEIGVKRAVGASAWHIVGQFLMEGILVMLVNILLSVALVADAMILYKFIQWVFFGVAWTATVSRYSIMMFGICSLSMTVLFSGIFAYRSSQVEIVQYLKME